jgi:hypothetical protein
MNEHIKQLADEAGLVRNGDFGMKRWEGPRSDSISDQDLEKFAELIVRECAELVETQHTWITSVAASALIRKHFGVEL